jgi:hypothetical protein
MGKATSGLSVADHCTVDMSCRLRLDHYRSHRTWASGWWSNNSGLHLHIMGNWITFARCWKHHSKPALFTSLLEIHEEQCALLEGPEEHRARRDIC